MFHDNSPIKASTGLAIARLLSAEYIAGRKPLRVVALARAVRVAERRHASNLSRTSSDLTRRHVDACRAQLTRHIAALRASAERAVHDTNCQQPQFVQGVNAERAVPTAERQAVLRESLRYGIARARSWKRTLRAYGQYARRACNVRRPIYSVMQRAVYRRLQLALHIVRVRQGVYSAAATRLMHCCHVVACRVVRAVSFDVQRVPYWARAERAKSVYGLTATELTFYRRLTFVPQHKRTVQVNDDTHYYYARLRQIL
jgi:hypothetical protein